MAIEGYYETGIKSAPPLYVQGFVHLPRLRVSHDVKFLIDTGADNTCLHPRDVGMFQIDYRRLRNSALATSAGIGGDLTYYREDAVLIFRDQSGEYLSWSFVIHLCVRPHSPTTLELPSLLGRDFINLCHFQANRSMNRALLDPLNVVNGIVLPPDLEP